MKWCRRFLQVRLSSLLVICTLTGGLLAWLAAERRESQRQLEIVRLLKDAQAGEVLVDFVRGGPFDKYDVYEQSWCRRMAETMLGSRVVEVTIDAPTQESLAIVGQLRDLVGLTVLDASEPASDLTAVGRLPKLRSLSLQHDAHGLDLSPVGELSQLETLELDVEANVDLSPLASLTQLTTLDLILDGPNVDRQGCDISSLASLKRLRKLSVFGPVFDLGPLAGLEELNSLMLNYTEADDLTPLANLHRLVGLDIGFCPVFDLSPIAELEHLEVLEVRGTGVVDLTPVGRLARLKELNICETAVSGLTPILQLKHLTSLHAYDTKVDADEWKRFEMSRPSCKVDCSEPPFPTCVWGLETQDF